METNYRAGPLCRASCGVGCRTGIGTGADSGHGSNFMGGPKVFTDLSVHKPIPMVIGTS